MEQVSELNEFMEGINRVGHKMMNNYLENFTGYLHDDKDISLTYFSLLNKMLANPKEMIKVQKNVFYFYQQQKQLIKNTLDKSTDGKKEIEPVIIPDNHDRRFNYPEWNEEPFFDFLKQNYLLVNKLMRDIIDDMEIDEKKRRKLNFYSSQYLDALSPSNYLMTNPVAIKEARETNGQSVVKGFKNLMDDINKGRITQTDHTAFEVGKTLAYTEGAVVYQNELIQLIQYKPLTEKVNEIPLLVIPPWINKYYILDLQENNSFVRFAVSQGFTVFIISWKNPNPSMGHIRFDDYVEMGIIKSGDVIQNITGSKKVNALGYCLGGTLLGVSAAVLKGKKKSWLNSMSFLATMLDFSDVGPMGDVIDEALVRKLERGELREEGVMRGQDMEKAFNLIRAKDLIWYYVENNYLMGKDPRPFDVLFWTNDNTNLPAEMYIYYLRNMVLENKLSKRNALAICDVPVNLRKIDVPAFVLGTIEDHISPAHTAFTTTELLNGDVQYVLGGSGHVMGIANPPSKKKYGFWEGGELDGGFDHWKQTAEYRDGSWWTPWSKWLAGKSGKQVVAPKTLGSKNYPELETAPGTYVMEKI